MKNVNYDKLTDEAYKVETVIKDGDVIIGTPMSYKDSSTIYKSPAPSVIKKIITGTNNDGYPIIKIRTEHIPSAGDMMSLPA